MSSSILSQLEIQLGNISRLGVSLGFPSSTVANAKTANRKLSCGGILAPATQETTLMQAKKKSPALLLGLTLVVNHGVSIGRETQDGELKTGAQST